MLRSSFFFLLIISSFCIRAQDSYVTYHHDIAPILQKHCVSCHQEGEVGAMPLTTYEEVASYGKMIQYVTATKLMPPWYADPTYSHFAGERVLNEKEINMIHEWVMTDMKEGALPYGQVISKSVSVTVLPREPDLVLSMAEAFEQFGIYVDQYQVFVIPTHLKADKWVEGIEFIPGNKKIDRYASIAVAPHGTFDSLDAWDPRYGYYSFGGLNLAPSQPYWYTWSPLQAATFFNSNAALFLPKESDLVLHMHYGPTGKPQKDSSEIRLWFSSDEQKYQIQSAPLLNPYGLTTGTFYIPANTKKVLHGDYTLPFDMQIISMTPQSNLICRAWEVYAKRPGETQPVKLLKIRDWNFNWKHTYRLETPVVLPAGTVLHGLAHFDNTLENPCNPNDKPKDVLWGSHLFSDQFLVHFQFLPANATSWDVEIYIPSVVSDTELPVEITTTRKGNYRFEITSTAGLTDPLIIGLILKSGKQKFTLSLADLVNGNYVLTIYDEAEKKVSESLFVKMWKKGL